MSSKTKVVFKPYTKKVYIAEVYSKFLLWWIYQQDCGRLFNEEEMKETAHLLSQMGITYELPI